MKDYSAFEIVTKWDDYEIDIAVFKTGFLQKVLRVTFMKA
jgi:hypothetical protein